MASAGSGTKVTTDPASKTAPIIEGGGVVTSDSLAAESIRAGGGFASNPRAGAMKQPSASTTTNNTDTSAAKVLAPAPDAEMRLQQEEAQAAAQGRSGAEGQTYTTPADERHKTEAETGQQGEHLSRPEKHSDGNAEPAPSYVHGSLQPGAMKPHGRNLHENEGFEGNEPNASFQSEIGSEDDPGRVAEQKFLGRNALAGGDAGAPKGSGVPGSQYSALDEASA